jgi:signal transduction histidine kinase
MVTDVDEVVLRQPADYVERTFRQVAQGKNLDFDIELDPEAPQGRLHRPERLQQVIKNLLSNAFKFTERAASSCASSPPRRAGATTTSRSTRRAR